MGLRGPWRSAASSPAAQVRELGGAHLCLAWRRVRQARTGLEAAPVLGGLPPCLATSRGQGR